ncbi:MAG: DUF2281 domain-containing protein [Lachnospiraceae bacterium]|nr:DUF2281 domain-containing protein [Lachnospiraceae bacterium]
MELRKQLINDIQILPESALQAISAVVTEFIVLFSEADRRDEIIIGNDDVTFGGWEGKIFMTEDFNTPMEEFEDYM